MNHVTATHTMVRIMLLVPLILVLMTTMILVWSTHRVLGAAHHTATHVVMVHMTSMMTTMVLIIPMMLIHHRIGLVWSTMATHVGILSHL